jgi:D-alanyl-D-alanine carboxypeptidase/D-alanyl-D-alanine-endopeptidase (penicillin-binding protein 4)
MPYYYSAQISGLNLDENVLRVTVDPGRRAGDPVRVTVTPTDRYAKLIVQARTTEKGQPSALRITRDLGQNDILVEGTLAVGAKPEDHRPEPITVENPTRFAAFYLMDRLARAGVEVTGGIGEGETPTSGTTEVARHEGEPFSEVLKKLNKPSDNLVAECLLKTLGAVKGKTGSTAAGREVAEAWFKSIGFDMGGLDMTDGSGLSRENFVSPHNFAILLKTMASHPNGKVWIDSLPIAGVDGTLRNRMKGTPAAGNCVAKSGYVSSVTSLSGYVTTKDGERLLFTMLMNNHKARNAVATGVQDKIVELLALYGK